MRGEIVCKKTAVLTYMYILSCMQQLLGGLNQQHLEILDVNETIVAYFWFEWVLNASYTDQRQVGDYIICVVPVWSDIGGCADVPM